MRCVVRALPTVFLLFFSAVTLQAQVTIENKLQAVEVVGVETSGQMIRLTLRNVSPKNITAIDFAISPENSTLTIDSDFSATDDVILIPTVSKEINIDVVPGQPTTKIGVLAVVFEDGMGEGVPARLDMIKNTRLGRRDQMRRIAFFWSSLLSTAQTGDEQTLGQILTTVLADVSALPETLDSGVATSHRNGAAQRMGLSDAKRDALFYLQQFQQSLADGISKEAMEFFIRGAKDQHDKILAKLEKGG